VSAPATQDHGSGGFASGFDRNFRMPGDDESGAQLLDISIERDYLRQQLSFRMRKTLTYGLTHLAVTVADLIRTKDFYCAVFDMEVMYDDPGFLQLTTPGCHDIWCLNPGRRRRQVWPKALPILVFGCGRPVRSA
jgi:hypothetical protein